MKKCDIEFCRGCAYEPAEEEKFFDDGFWDSCLLGIMLGLWILFLITL